MATSKASSLNLCREEQLSLCANRSPAKRPAGAQIEQNTLAASPMYFYSQIDSDDAPVCGHALFLPVLISTYNSSFLLPVKIHRVH
jgi:hypothetical protein